MAARLLGYALAAAAKGFAIFPVKPNDKTPGRLYPDRPEHEAPWLIKWYDVATTDPAQIVRWWTTEPRSNIGISAKRSGLLVIDCDTKTGNGFDEWHEIASGFDPYWYCSPLYVVRTGSGGCHIYYRWPEHVQASQSGLSANVDIRSNGGERGGYVLGPGSVTAKGPYLVEEGDAPPPAPPWLVELCRERPRVQQPRSRYERPAPVSFAGLVASVATAHEGNRNQALLWAARSMTQDGADLQACLDALAPAATSNGLTYREAEATITSGHRIQSSKGIRR